MARVTYRLLLGVVAALAVAALGGMALLYPGDIETVDDPSAAQQTALLDATLVAVEPAPDSDPAGLPPGASEVLVTARIDETGEEVTFLQLDDTGATFGPGQRVRLARVFGPDPAMPTYLISDFRRGRPLVLLTVLFVAAVVAFGRLQGARALLGLGLTALLVVGFLVPAVLEGRDPVVAALAASIAVMLVTLYLSHGVSRKTTAAAVGTGVALLLTGVLAVTFVSAAELTGFSSEEARLVSLEAGGLSLRGLLLAGIILGGLGVLDDVTVSQASTVFELARADRSATFASLVRGALAVGRDHVAATVNTLFLAYAGASLPLLILFATGIDPLGTVLTSEIVAVEVVRTLVGSIGLIAAVPVTTALAAALAVAEPDAAAAEAEDGHGHGRRQASAPSSPVEAPAPTARAARQADEEPPEDAEWVAQLREAYGLDRYRRERDVEER